MFILFCPVFYTDQQVKPWVPEVFSRLLRESVSAESRHILPRKKSLLHPGKARERHVIIHKKRNGERECNNKKHAGRKKYNWYAHSDGVIIMQSKIGQGWCFLLLRKCLLVSFRFGVNIIQWLLYNVIWWSYGRPQHGKGCLFSDWRGRIPVPHDHLRVTILIPRISFR